MSGVGLHVLVVGGGFGGLCLAQGLKRAGVSVGVYERDRGADARLQGYRLNIEPVGAAALRECLPGELWDVLVASSGDPGPGMGVYDERLREFMTERSNTGERAAEERTHAVSRVTLRGVMLAGLEDVVEFGKEFTGYERMGDGKVRALFADGSSAVGDVLVGADGARSRVRRQLLPQARTIDTPGFGVGGKLALTDQTEGWLPAPILTNKNMFLPKKDFLFTSVFRRRESSAEVERKASDRRRMAGVDSELVLREAKDYDYVMWAFVAHRRAYPKDLGQARGKALRDYVEQRMSGWHPDLRRMVRETDPDTVELFDFTAAKRMKPWQTGNVTLLGDAVHNMPPVGGLGGNAALYDASRLCRALTAVDRGERELEPALREYEADMIENGFSSVRESLLYLWLAILPSRIVRGVARSFFRLCGAIPPLKRAVFES
jgi:2-polyprenyl-6-methoxyphenol hydroxylase-like FAD-dependent oxidoreductase